MKFDRDQAEAMALRALAYLAADADRLGRFLALTGIGPADIRARLDDPLFLAGILDHLLSDERLLIEFAKNSDIDPAAVQAARRKLPGEAVEFE